MLDWPIQGFAYEDEQHQRVSEDLAFTLVDFIASDRPLRPAPRARSAGEVERQHDSGGRILSRERKGLPDKVPSLLMVDAGQRAAASARR